ncbi:hypothetical protein JS756_00935 [Streptomyces actuosus]|uniref:Ig-like domain-containing protein n=1 Tax=Streptomyces actuosus TaxID=1885 RepID=A0ABS2VHX8_STRAS|nr:hypothetical protein [Streptomyces actuosus]MBN0042698.1 hypothetical protein [Streptomyces actuosus]
MWSPGGAAWAAALAALVVGFLGGAAAASYEVVNIFPGPGDAPPAAPSDSASSTVPGATGSSSATAGPTDNPAVTPGPADTPAVTPRPTDTAPNADSADGSVYRETGNTPVTIKCQSKIDLDSTAPDWGTDTARGTDIGFCQPLDSTRFLWSRDKLSIITSEPTVATCAATTINDRRLTAEQTRKGTQMCVLTSEGRWAYVSIAGVDQERDTISMNITVWNT